MRGHEIGPATPLKVWTVADEPKQAGLICCLCQLPEITPWDSKMTTFRSTTSLAHSTDRAQMGLCFSQRSRYKSSLCGQLYCAVRLVANSDFRVSVAGFPTVTSSFGLNSGSSPAQGEEILVVELVVFSIQGSNDVQWLWKETHGNSRHKIHTYFISTFNSWAKPRQQLLFAKFWSQNSETENSRHPRELLYHSSGKYT